MSKWISINERSPPAELSWVLVYQDGAINCAMYDEKSNTFSDPTFAKCYNVVLTEITHWMPLPAPPEQ